MLIEQVKLFHKELKLEHECDDSEGWLQVIKRRHGISMHKVCGEKPSANDEGPAEHVNVLAKLVDDKRLSPEKMYNEDETALSCQCTQQRTLTAEDEGTTGLI